jgi:hypothetical protein
LILSYNSYFYNDEKIKNSSIAVLKANPYSNEGLLNTMNSFVDKKPREGKNVFDNFDNVSKFLGFLGLYQDFNVNEFNEKLALQDACKFTDVLVKEIGPNIKSEGGVLAMTKVLQNFLKKGDEFKNHLLIKNNKFDEVILKSAMNNFKPNSYEFDNTFLKDFDKLFDTIGKTTEQGNLTESYLNYLEHVYLKSPEILEHYNDKLNSDEKLDPKLEELVNSVKNYVNLYLNQDGNDSVVRTNIKKLANQVFIIFYLVPCYFEKSKNF